MRRVLIISSAALAILAVTIVVAAMALFHTGPGRAFLIAQVESELVDEFGGKAQIGALNGALPGRPSVENLVLSDAQGPWLTVERIDMEWRPLRLLSGRIDIERMHIAGAHLLREPPPQVKEESKDERLSLRLPNDLPNLRIGALALEDFRSDLGGQTGRLDGAGAADMNGKRISATLKLASENDRDNVDVTIERAPKADRLYIDATIAGAEDGVIAALADLGGPAFIEIKSDGSGRRAVVAVNGAVGAYGELHATLAGDVERLSVLDLAGEFTPGGALNHITELSAPVVFDMRLEEKRRGGVLTIARLTSALGAIEGTLEWESARAVTNRLTADLKAAFAETYRPDEQALIGDKASLSAVIRRRGERYAFNATLDSDRMRAAVDNGSTDFEKRFGGDLTALVHAREEMALLGAATELSARVDIDLDDRLQLQDLTVTREDGSSAAGVFSYRFNDETIGFDGDISLAPVFVSTLVPSLAPADFTEASVSLSGPADRFTLNATANTPAVKIGEDDAPPLDITIALAGLPSLPTGDVTAAAKNGDGRFEATLRSSLDGRIALPRLFYSGEGFSLTGAGAFERQTEALELDLRYSGDAGAEPWPGVALEGAFAVNGTASRQSAATELTLTAPSIRFNDFAAAGLNARASGPPGAVDATLQAAQLTLARGGLVEDLSLAATVDLQGGPDMTFSALGGVAADNVFSLRQPATILILDNGVSVDGLRLNWGRAGAVALDGGFSDDRWRAALRLTDANVPGADGRVTLDLDLDTDKDVPARGSFRLRSLLTQEQEAAISGDLLWDGRAVILTSAEDAGAIDMRLALPAQLVRTPALGINTDGALAGYARYDGSIDVIAAYMPAALQAMEGSLTADLSFAGTTTSPEITGVAEIAGGAYTELHSGFSLTGLHAQATAAMRGDQSVVRFSGGARGAGDADNDTITLTGEMTLGEASNVALTIGLNGAEMSARPVEKLRANGRIDISGPFDALAADGAIEIEELDAQIITPENTELTPITVVAYSVEDASNDADEIGPAAAIDYDIRISADDRIFIRGRGLESEWSADLSAADQDDAPLILGQMTLRRGWIDFSGRRFDLTRGSIAFDALSPNNPRLDIRAEHETADGVTAIIAVGGRAEAPSVELTSTPSLPSEDVMALVLFGKPADELTALESLQTAQALASLGGIGPFGGDGDITGSLRRAVGLDLLNLNIDSDGGGGSLTIGKYVADGLFVSATQDARGESGAVRIEYEIVKNITVESEIEQDGDQTVSANWKRDF